MANEDSAEVARAWAKRCATLERELAAARATIASAQWTPITSDNLPKVGDEVAYFIYPPTFPNGYCSDVQAVCVDWNKLSRWYESKFTHFRPISPPAQASAA